MESSQPSRSFLWRGAFGLVVLAQGFLCFQGLGDRLVRGHNGFNTAAFLLSARNTLRWDVILPVQYYTGRVPPTLDMGYTHHPLAMHLHDTASVWLFGDSEASLRLVPALHGLLVVVALLFVVSRLWGRWTGIAAGVVYVILPINGIYVNMANTSNGFIFWALVGFYGYVRQHRAANQGLPRGRWLALTFGAFLMAMQWDWPAYYLVFGIAVHWLIGAVARARRSGRWFWRIGRDVWLLAAWSAMVLASFFGHFWLMRWLVGGETDLISTFAARQEAPLRPFGEHLQIVPPLMFTWFVLAICALWLVVALVRIALGRFLARDLIPLLFGLGGAVHYVIFKWSALIHSYWAWTTLPFVAIAMATTMGFVARALRRLSDRLIPERARWARRGAAAVTVLLAIALLIPLARRSLELIPAGRRVGGSMWFVTTVRTDQPETYDSGRRELRFAEQVNAWTTRGTGVIIDRGFLRFRPECRFDTTLDRVMHYQRDVPEAPPRVPGVSDGWVYMGDVRHVRRDDRVALAASYPYYQIGDLFMIDMRRNEVDVRIWTEEERRRTAWEWFWYSPWEPAVERVRDPASEAEMLARLEAIAQVP